MLGEYRASFERRFVKMFRNLRLAATTLFGATVLFFQIYFVPLQAEK